MATNWFRIRIMKLRIIILKKNKESDKTFYYINKFFPRDKNATTIVASTFLGIRLDISTFNFNTVLSKKLSD